MDVKIYDNKKVEAMSTNETQLTLSKEYMLSPAYQQEKAFGTKQRMAQAYAASTIVPATYQNNVGNCYIAVDFSERLQLNPLTVMQNLYIVHGNPAFSSKFLIACINASRRFSPLRYEFTPDRTGCRVVCYERSDTKHQYPLEGEWVTMQMAEKEGWISKNGSKWRTMPELMMRYRAAAFWSRLYAPEISMGLYTVEEMEDIPYAEVEELDDENTDNSVFDFGDEPEQTTDKEIEIETPKQDLFD